jgi:hypothetical protein
MRSRAYSVVGFTRLWITTVSGIHAQRLRLEALWYLLALSGCRWGEASGPMPISRLYCCTRLRLMVWPSRANRAVIRRDP